ncbi:hypothetical protein DW322_21245 [Rhodococcus rhodnii]|uniref:Uncharacterized protein n=2 Tax=Rhodococcus rhodnii TaxID=38312 RepID=R7WR30_9NOCA|nr:hypothetical protein [Rhodococcus rhodnii]EOM77767.1 hypothetical protein Rrhod_0835 [Rhodococcus rhodnii LMG 5362]TXG92226.1 hypothetical protein DW322_21245 [Rhodococcus rhodnii]
MTNSNRKVTSLEAWKITGVHHVTIDKAGAVLGVRADENGLFDERDLRAAVGARRNRRRASQRPKHGPHWLSPAGQEAMRANVRELDERPVRLTLEKSTEDSWHILGLGLPATIWRLDLPHGLTWGLTHQVYANPDTAPIARYGRSPQEIFDAVQRAWYADRD